MIDIWTERYRPETLDEVIGHRNIVERLKAFVEEESVPNMLFAGPAGTGKTTSAIALAKDLYGDEWKQNFMETNASDDRGISVVRNEIKNFARTKSVNADFKIIFLDESDALTPDAQQALRRTMEKYSNACRFILSCNFSSKIIEPIQSRTAVFRFNRLDEEGVKDYLNRIEEGEDLELKESGINALIKVSGGDLRKVTNVLQAASISESKITEELVYEISASLKPDEVKEILNKALDGNFKKSRKKLSELMIDRGLAGDDVIKAIHREIFDLEVSEKAKLEIIRKLGEYDFRITEGGSPDIQIESLLAQISSLEESRKKA